MNNIAMRCLLSQFQLCALGGLIAILPAGPGLAPTPPSLPLAPRRGRAGNAELADWRAPAAMRSISSPR
jgi:hypothetical protein